MSSSEDLVAALGSCLGDHFSFDAGELLDGLGLDEALVRPLIAFLEEHPAQDFGSPGPLVHLLERFPPSAYVGELLASVERSPTFYTLWMLERVLNANEPGELRRQVLDGLRSLTRRAALSPACAQQIQEALERHG